MRVAIMGFLLVETLVLFGDMIGNWSEWFFMAEMLGVDYGEPHAPAWIAVGTVLAFLVGAGWQIFLSPGPSTNGPEGGHL